MLSFTALGACAAGLHEASSGPTGCAPSDIQIIEDGPAIGTHTWIARCHGREYRCSGYADDRGPIPFLSSIVGAACSPAFEQRRTVVASSSRKASSVREGRHDGHESLSSIFSDGELTLALYGVPALHPHAVALFIEVPASLAGRTCELGLTIDGKPATPTPRARWVADNRVKISLPAPVLTSMAASDGVVGRVCDREYRLDASDLRIVKAFDLRFQEKAAFATKAASIPQAAND